MAAVKEVMLEVKNVSKHFRMRHQYVDSLKGSLARLFSPKTKTEEDFTALKNISFNLYKGEALGTIGKNGAGKSTLLRILSGINVPDEGEINFYGKAVSILDIGAGFHPELTGKENIYLSASLYKFTRQETEAKFNDIVAFSGIGKFIDEPVKNYSSGMYLRLAFSIITCLDADIYLIDEVVNVGDANFQMKCKNRIEEMMAAGKTMLIASHNMNEISILCNRILLMEHGEVIQMGGPDIIQKYMSLALPQYFKFDGDTFFHIKDLSQSPFQQKKISIDNYGIKDYHVNTEGINAAYSFKVFFDVNILEKNVDAEIRLKFYDATGALIFTATSNQNGIERIDQLGKYHIEFNVPANLFNARLYSIGLRIGNNFDFGLLFNADNFISIKMSDNSRKGNSDHEVTLHGLMKPQVPITINRLN